MISASAFIINNALNEVCNGMSLDGEFSTRMGCSLEEARQLLDRIHALAGPTAVSPNYWMDFDQGPWM